MWIRRDIEQRLQLSARTRPVVVLTGARQTGKTSTFRRLFPDYKFVSLDLPTEAEQAEKEPQSFLRRHPPPVIIDEVQYAPGLFRYLKAAVDADRGGRGTFQQRLDRLGLKRPNVDRSAATADQQGTSIYKLHQVELVWCMLATCHLHQLVTDHDLGVERMGLLFKSNRNIDRVTDKCRTKAPGDTDGTGPDLAVLQTNRRGNLVTADGLV